MSSTVVHVKNIGHDTSEKEVRDFFSFCGKISSLSVTPESEDPNSPQSATVTFEKETFVAYLLMVLIHLTLLQCGKDCPAPRQYAIRQLPSPCFKRCRIG
jgi:hypothetical protein